jgi:hypothetical protein
MTKAIFTRIAFSEKDHDWIGPQLTTQIWICPMKLIEPQRMPEMSIEARVTRLGEVLPIG